MEQNLAVLIDFENLAAGTEKEGLGRFKVEAVMRRLKDKGRILVARSYGDWGRFARFKQDLLRQSVTLMELTSYRGQEKNRADIALAVDAMELAYTRDYIDTFVVMSGDSDFTPLITRLKELNKRVIGIGTRRSTSGLLKDACDEFIFYDSLVRNEPPAAREPARRPEPAEPERDEVETLSKEEALALLVETTAGLQRDAPGPVLASVIKASILRKEPAFDESEYGYSGFARMLEDARDKGLLSLSKDERAGGYRVDLTSDEDRPSAAPADDEPEDDEDDDLPGLDGEAARLRNLLRDNGTDPLNPLFRHTVVYEFVDHVSDRIARKKRNTLMYVVGDISRRCRKTDPQIPAKHVRSIIVGLARAGLLLHPDGKPVRGQTAPFLIQKDAEGMLHDLNVWFLQRLAELGESLTDARSLSQLLYGDEEHVLRVEEMVAWLMHEAGDPNRRAAAEPAPRAREPRSGEGRNSEGRNSEGRNSEGRNGRRARDAGRSRSDAAQSDADAAPAAIPAADPPADADATQADAPAAGATLTEAPAIAQAPAEDQVSDAGSPASDADAQPETDEDAVDAASEEEAPKKPRRRRTRTRTRKADGPAETEGSAASAAQSEED